MSDIERIERLGVLSWHGYSQYIQEAKKNKTTTEKAIVYEDHSVQMPDGCGQSINILV